MVFCRFVKPFLCNELKYSYVLLAVVTESNYSDFPLASTWSEVIQYPCNGGYLVSVSETSVLCYVAKVCRRIL